MKQLAMLAFAVGLVGLSAQNSMGQAQVPDMQMATPDMTAPHDAITHERAGGENCPPEVGVVKKHHNRQPGSTPSTGPTTMHHRHHHRHHDECGAEASMLPCDQSCDVCQQCTNQSNLQNTQPTVPPNVQENQEGGVEGGGGNVGREPQSENTQTTDKEKLGIRDSQAEVVCTDSPHAHAPFLRSDLAYSVTGVDCSGDLPAPLGETPKIVGRGIASTQLKCGPHDHPMFNRTDLSYGVTGEDCYGDPVNKEQ